MIKYLTQPLLFHYFCCVDFDLYGWMLTSYWRMKKELGKEAYGYSKYLAVTITFDIEIALPKQRRGIWIKEKCQIIDRQLFGISFSAPDRNTISAILWNSMKVNKSYFLDLQLIMWFVLNCVARQNHAKFHSISCITPKSRQNFCKEKGEPLSLRLN